MPALNCLIVLGLLVHLASSDVSLTIGPKENVKSDQAHFGYDYSGSYSTVAPENKARYVTSYSTAAPGNKAQYVGFYSTAAPDNRAQYVSSYSTPASDNKAQYVGSYSTAAPDNKAQYVASYSTSAPGDKAQYVGSYSTADPDNKAQYVSSYSTPASDNKAQYIGSYSTAAPDNKAQYVASYSTPASDNKAQYVGSYSTAAPYNKAQYIASYSTPASDNKAQYVGSYSTAAPDSRAQYVSSYSTPASDNKAQYVGSYSTAAPDNKAQYVASYSTPASDNKAQNVGSYSTAAPYNRAQYVASYSTPAPNNRAKYVGYYSTAAPSKAQYVDSYATAAPASRAQYVASSSRSSYDAYPSGQISSDRQYYSAKQEEYNPQYQNDRGVLLISKELQVPFAVSKENDKSKDCDDNKDDSKVNQQVQVNDIQKTEYGVQEDQTNIENVPIVQNVENYEETKPVYKTSKYEVRRPGIRKEFYDIEEKVFIKPAGSAIFELQHDKPQTAAIVNKHVLQQQSYPYPQYSYDDSQYYPQEQEYANHGYRPVIIQPVPSTGHDYNPGHSLPGPHVTYPGPHHYNPVYPSTTVTPGYVPPVIGAYLPPCETTPPPPPSKHNTYELSEEADEENSDDVGEHDYDSDAGYISQIKEQKKDFADVVYAPSKSNSYGDRENYRQAPVYGPEARIDRLRVEYENQRGDLGQQKLPQYRQQFHQEYVPNGNVNPNRVQIRPNGAPPAKYTQDVARSQIEIENSKRLLDLYSANGDVTEIGFGGRSQQYQVPSKSGKVQARVVSVTPAPEYANYVDEQHQSRRVVLSKPLYTVQHVEVREHNHRLVEEAQSDSVEPKISEFQKLRLIGTSSGKVSLQRRPEVNDEVEYITPVPQ